MKYYEVRFKTYDDDGIYLSKGIMSVSAKDEKAARIELARFLTSISSSRKADAVAVEVPYPIWFDRSYRTYYSLS